MGVTLQALHRSRERNVPVEDSAGAFTLTVRWPGEGEFMRLFRRAEIDLDLARPLVVGWAGVTERHLLPSGTDDPQPFVREVFECWFADRDDLWLPVIETAKEMREHFKRQREADQKN